MATSDHTASAAITGAIFDCDGTLVDSMPMWNSLVEDIFDEHGIAKTPELLAEAEAYNFDDMCFWFHERFGIGESGEALLASIRATVQGHYVNDISLFDGCRAFLDELKAVGVRMLILSATTEPEVRVALATHGIEDYFERVIQTSETGSDKEHAEAYQYALDALGISCEIRGMVKDDHHRTRAIVDEDGAEVWIKNNQTVFSFIGTVQEEVHRYAIGYHRQLRAKTGAGSELDKIPGIGPQRRNALLSHFKSVKAIREAALEELQVVVPAAQAQAVYAYFHEGDAK